MKALTLQDRTEFIRALRVVSRITFQFDQPLCPLEARMESGDIFAQLCFDALQSLEHRNQIACLLRMFWMVHFIWNLHEDEPVKSDNA